MKPKRIAFFGHFGMGNFGNESTLYAFLYNLTRFFPDAELLGICTGPETIMSTYKIPAVLPAEVSGARSIPRNRLTKLARMAIGIPRELYRWAKGIATLRLTDMLIIPGTGLLTDAYGLWGWGPYNLFKWSLIAKLCRCRLFFISVGGGPVYGNIARYLTRAALWMATFRSYRDSSTRQYLRTIGFWSNADKIYPDLAYSLPDHLIPRQTTLAQKRPVIGIGLMMDSGRYSSASPTEATFPRYLDNLARTVAWLVGKGYDIRLLIGDKDDTRATQEFRTLLKVRLGGDYEEHIYNDLAFSFEDLLSQIAASDIVVATRFHNVLLSLLSGKPVISISFHPKCASLMSAVGLADYCVEIDQLNADVLIKKICALQEDSLRVRELLAGKLKEYRAALEEQYRLIFTGV